MRRASLRPSGSDAAGSLENLRKSGCITEQCGGQFYFPTERLSANAFDTVIDIVLKGTKNCTLAFGKHWIETQQNSSTILNIVTTYAFTGSAYVVPSAAAKAGVLAMTRSLAVESGQIRNSHQRHCSGALPNPRRLGQIVAR